jgi:Flp pilus assembly protein TadB
MAKITHVKRTAPDTETYYPIRSSEPPAQHELDVLQSQGRLSEVVHGDHVNRAQAFLLRTLFLAIIAGVAMVIIGSVVADFPVLSIIATLVLFVTMAAVFVFAYLLDAFLSVPGIEFLDNWRKWRYLNREQAERHRRMED